MTLTELKIIYRMGDDISFNVSNHKDYPSTVLVHGKPIDRVSKSTINAFEKWLNKELRE